MRLVSILVCSAFNAVVVAQQPDIVEHPSRMVARDLDSGYVDHNAPAPAVVFRGRVQVTGAAYMRLHFDRTNLPVGTRLRLTSVHDGAIELFDAISLAEYQNYSSWFNGDAIDVELVAGAHTVANRVRVVAAAVGEGLIIGPLSICGPTDDRQPSDDPRQGRQYPTGCTSWLIDLHTVVTAGHCTTNTAQQVHFNVPPSSGGIVLPPPQHQYRYDTTAVQRLNNGVGQDWCVASTLRNATTGLYAGQGQGGTYYELVPPPAFAASQNIRITGYGTASNPTRTQTQQTHVGPRINVTNQNALGYRTDTTGGNSGSPVILESTGQSIGVHTHGGCTSSNTGNNSGTSYVRSDFQNAVAAIRPLKRPGGYVAYGSGCGVGTPPRLANNGFPEIGRSMSIDVTGTPADAPCLLFFGVRLATPIDLSFTGMGGCNLHASADIGLGFTADGTGRGALPIGVPSNVELLGVRFANQAAVVSAGGTAANVVMTNAGEGTIGQF